MSETERTRISWLTPPESREAEAPEAAPRDAEPAAESSPGPRITLLATGGTIAGEHRGESGAGYRAGALPIDFLLAADPRLRSMAEITSEQFTRIASQDVDTPFLLGLAARTRALLAEPEVEGLVITHGSDTLEETAYFLNLTVDSDKPIVLVVAMRPATALGADGPMNLFNGLSVAAAPEAYGRGVLAVVNDEIHHAAEVTKVHTSRPDALGSPNRGLAGTCTSGQITWYSPCVRRHTTLSVFAQDEPPRTLPEVEILYGYAGVGRDSVAAALRPGIAGIVVAGVGGGNLSTAASEALAEAARRGVVVVRSSRCGAGAVARDIEVEDSELGFVAARELNPQKARILLRLALTRTRDPAEIQALFETY